MGDLSERLQEELSVAHFNIEIAGWTISISESVVLTWALMAVLVALSIFLTHGMTTRNISKRQAVAELIVTKLEGIIEGMIGEHGKPYITYLASILIYLGVANLIGILDLGLFGIKLKAPTKDLNVTVALALMSIILIEFAGIRAKGFGGWLKSFAQPVAVVLPINILEIVIKPLSLCMRLFGNILGAYTIMELLKMVCMPILPAAASLYFDIFDGLIQAYVFVFLTSMYIKEAVE